MDNLNIQDLSPEAKAKLLKDLQADQQAAAQEKRQAYEALRKDLICRIFEGVENENGSSILGVEIIREFIGAFYKFVVNETTAFYGVMNEYGQLSREGQMNYKITHENYRLEVKTNKVKKFDERAELAAGRLITFLQEWIKNSAKGTDDPMYQLAMSMLSRNQHGDLDYKSISKLYDLEDKFGSPDYSEIMQLFKESNQVEGTMTNFYFYKKDELGVWRKMEISFNRL